MANVLWGLQFIVTCTCIVPIISEDFNEGCFGEVADVITIAGVNKVHGEQATK